MEIRYSGDIWEEAIYLEFKESFSSKGVRIKFMIKNLEYVPNLLMKYGKR